MIFWWIVVVWNPNFTTLLERFLKLMTYCVYKNDAKTSPEFEFVVVPLKVTFFSIELPSTVFLFIVVKNWAAFADFKLQDPKVEPEIKGS